MSLSASWREILVVPCPATPLLWLNCKSAVVVEELRALAMPATGIGAEEKWTEESFMVNANI